MPSAAHSAINAAISDSGFTPVPFTLGTTKPGAANTGYAANGLAIGDLGTNGTLASVIAPGSGSPSANSSPQNVSGIRVVSANGTLDGYTINGDVVLMSGATIRNCIVHGRVIDYGGGCLIENNEIDGFDNASDYPGASVGGVFLYMNLRPAGTTQSTLQFNRIHARVASTYVGGPAFRNYYAYRNDVYDVVDGLDCAPAASGQDPNVRLEGNYVHELTQLTPDSAHADNMSHCDGTQMHGNPSNAPFYIVGNYYAATESSFTNTSHPSYQNYSCLMLNNDYGAPNIIATQNWFYGAQVMINGSGSSNVTATFQNNRFDTSTTPGYAAWFKTTSSITWSGNTDQNGNTVTPYYN